MTRENSATSLEEEDLCSCYPSPECRKRMAGTLTGAEIAKYKLISPLAESDANLQATTFDLSIGAAHYVYNGKNDIDGKKWNLVFIGTEEERKRLNRNLSPDQHYKRPKGDNAQQFTIPAYGSALIQLNETIDTYTVAKQNNILIVGRFDLKLSRVHQGLLSQQATQIEPCYQGKIYCFVHNLTNQDVKLAYGERIATIEFSYVSCYCNSVERKEIIDQLILKNRTKYNCDGCNGRGIEEIKYFYYNNRLPDNCGLLGIKDIINEPESIEKISENVNKKIADDRDDKNKRADRNLKIFEIFVSAVIALITTFGLFFFNQNDERITKLENEIKAFSSEDNPELSANDIIE